MTSSQCTVAILAADVVGYSRMLAENEETTLTELRRVRHEIVEPAFVVHEGKVVKRLGDGWLVAFDKSESALRCAVRIQDNMASGSSLRLRIGVHFGTTNFVDDDIFGTGINVAARLEALAVPGSVAASAEAMAGADPTICSEFLDAGPRSLKNIPNPVRVWARGGLPLAPIGAADDTIASILVEPFSSAGADPDLAVFAEGLSEDVAAALSRFRWLAVVADERNDPKEASRPARYVLGGSVQRAGAGIRLAARLTSTSAQRRLWSDRFDRQAKNLFALQDELTATLASSVYPVIDANEKATTRLRPVETLTATELSLRTNDILSTGRTDSLEEADALTKRAVALQPQNAQAHVQRSHALYRKGMSGAFPANTSLRDALDSARATVRLDGRLASGHAMLACIRGMLGETDGALDAAKAAASLNPGSWAGDHGRSVALTFAAQEWAAARDPTATGQIEASRATLGKSGASAFRSGHLCFLGIGLMLRDADGDLTEAISELRRSATAEGATWWSGVFLAAAELRRGSPDLAARRLDEARELFPALSLTAIRDLFGSSRIWSAWSKELMALSDLGLPIE